MTSPTASKSTVVVDLMISMPVVRVAVTTTGSEASSTRGGTGPPGGVGGCAEPVATLTTSAGTASRSAWVTVCWAVHVATSPGASVMGEHDGAASALGSDTDTAARVTLPVLVTVMT